MILLLQRQHNKISCDAFIVWKFGRFEIQMDVLLLIIMVEVLLTISNFSLNKKRRKGASTHTNVYTDTRTHKDHLNKYEQMGTNTYAHTRTHTVLACIHYS